MVRDPYQVLGLRPGASEAEIKRTYRELVKKYHPDRYRDNPLAELAEEKLREINEAYEYLMSQRQGSGPAWSRSGSGEGEARAGGRYSSGTHGDYARVRQLIDLGDLDQAEELMRNLNPRDPEWMFLKGVISLRKGWYDQAYHLFRQAAAAAPDNFEYRQAVEQMETANRAYQAAGRRREGVDPCTVCTALWCTDCMCECCGGDLIQCC